MDLVRKTITLQCLKEQGRRGRKFSLTPKSEMWPKENHPSIITSVTDHDRITERSHRKGDTHDDAEHFPNFRHILAGEICTHSC